MSKDDSVNKQAKLSIELDEELRKKFKAKAALDGISMRDAIIKLIENYVENKKK